MAVLAVALFFGPSAASAQVSDRAESVSASRSQISQSDNTAIETIVVTGQKRETTLQESDFSVSVFNEEAIRNARVRDFRRIDDLVPNVQFTESGQASTVFIGIRGVESNPFIINRAAIYIDGIPFRELNNAVLNQIQSIEVLRGPQSTLYGANTEAGLILINTLEPKNELTGNVRATAGFFGGGERHGIDGFVAAPLNEDALSGSLAFKASFDDSYFPNGSSSIDEPGELDELFLQARLTWRPTDELTIKTTSYILDLDAPGIYDEEYLPASRALYDTSYSSFNGGKQIGRFEILMDAPRNTQTTDFVTGVSANYQLTDGAIDAALSYVKREEDSRGNDLDFTALPTAAGAAIYDEDVLNGELRYTSRDSSSLQYLLGASFYSEVEELYVGTLVGPGGLADYQFAPPQRRESRDIAIFGSASFGLGLDGLSFTAGLRYDNARRETAQTAGTLSFGPLGDAVFQAAKLSDTFDAFLPRFALSYRPTQYWTFYASASRGYIPGGFNLTIAQEAVADDVIRFDSESLSSFEVGLKHQFANGRGYVNIAAFFIDANNWQEISVITNEQGQVLSSSFTSSDSAIENKGFEIEFSYAFADRFSLDANFGYVDAEYTRLLPTSFENLAGNSVQLVADYDANIALRYEHPTGWFARAELNAIGETALDNRNRFIREPVEVLNFQAGYEGDRFSLRAFLENATNERFEAGLAFDNFAFGTDGNSYAAYNAPRLGGLEMEIKF